MNVPTEWVRAAAELATEVINDNLSAEQMYLLTALLKAVDAVLDEPSASDKELGHVGSALHHIADSLQHDDRLSAGYEISDAIGDLQKYLNLKLMLRRTSTGVGVAEIKPKKKKARKRNKVKP